VDGAKQRCISNGISLLAPARGRSNVDGLVPDVLLC
jgi:hypothetical protein